jgi:hypothetical protein
MFVMRTGSKTIMNVIAAAVLGIVSVLGLLGATMAVSALKTSQPTTTYSDTLEVIEGNPNSVQQSHSVDTSLLQPAGKSE